MKICRRLIAMVLAMSFLSLLGCTKKAEKFKPADGAEITSFGISESQMNRYYTYSFLIYEENNIVYFSANMMLTNGEEINFEDCIVEQKDMDNIRIIAKEINLVEYIKNYKKPKIQIEALDAPSYSTSVTMSDGSKKAIDRLCDDSIQLKNYFTTLAVKYRAIAPKLDPLGTTDIDESETVD